MEAEILYTAVFDNEKTIRFAPDRLVAGENLISGFPGGKELEDIVCLLDVKRYGYELFYDLEQERLVLAMKMADQEG